MKNIYLILNLIIIAIPLFLTFLPAFKFYRRYRALWLSIVIVGGLFFLWDILATARGNWSFNDKYVSGIKIMGLPYEELLFFITVPYSCLFLYETLRSLIVDVESWYSRSVYLILALLAFFFSYISRSSEYASLVLLIFGLLMAAGGLLLRKIFSSSIYWIWITAGMLLFVIFNYILTALPVVIYNPGAITNIRVLTIPIEDFLYNFSMLTCYLALYLYFRSNNVK